MDQRECARLETRDGQPVHLFIKGVMAVFAQVSGEDGGVANGKKAETQNKPTKGQEHGPA